MTINNISNTAPSDSLIQSAPSPPPQDVAPMESSGRGSIQTLRPMDSMEKPEKSENQTKKPDAEKTKELVEELNEYMDDLQTQLGFSIREDLNHQVVVEIKNRETDTLIKQIPSEELLKIKKKMEELTGIIFDQSV